MLISVFIKKHLSNVFIHLRFFRGSSVLQSRCFLISIMKIQCAIGIKAATKDRILYGCGSRKMSAGLIPPPPLTEPQPWVLPLVSLHKPGWVVFLEYNSY